MEGAPVLEVVDSPLDAEDALLANQPLPDALPVLPLRDTVTFPETLTPLAVGQERSIQLVNDVLGASRMLVMVASRDPENEVPGPEDLYAVGVVGVVARMIKVPDGSLRILVQGTQRVRLGPYVAEQPYLVARIAELPDVSKPSPELEALTRNVQRTFSEIVEQIPYLPEELQMAVANLDDPAALGHLIAGALRIGTEEKQKLLEEIDVAKRLRHLSRILARELEVVQLGTQIQTQVQSEIDKGQREFFLRQQLKAIQEELGEEDEQLAEVNELRERIDSAQLPEQALKAASSRGWRNCRRPPPSTASSAPTWSGWSSCPGRSRPRTTSTFATPARSSTPTTTTSRKSRTGSSSTWRCASSTRTRRGRSSASSGRPASARPASAARSPRRSVANSSGSRSAASATRRRSAATAAPI
jgi:Lon protease-like protein